MSASCSSCTGPVADGFLCRSCTRELREALTDLAPGRSLLPGHAEGPAGRGITTRWDLPSAVVVGELAGHLDTTVARLARIHPGTGGGERPVVFHEKGAEIRALLARTLAPWAAWLLDLERPPPLPVPLPPCTHRVDPDGPPPPCEDCAAKARARDVLAARRARWARQWTAVQDGRVSDMAGLLLERLPALTAREEVGAFAQEIDKLVERLNRIIDRPAELIAVGECGAELPDETVCTRHLYVDPAERYVDCPACKTQWKVAERRAWLLAAAEDSLGTAATISSALTRLDQPVTPERIRKWKERGRLKVHGREPAPPCRDHQGRGRQPASCAACAAKEGAPLYRLGDVVDLLTEAMAAEARRAAKKAS